MIYLIKNLSKTYDIVVNDINQLPTDSTYNVLDSTYYIDEEIFANIIYMPSGLVQGSQDSFKPTKENMAIVIDNLYHENRDEILQQNKDKFIIAVVRHNTDNSKEILYTNSYLNLLESADEYNKLPNNNPIHHYEIFNYKTDKFEIFITKDNAIAKLLEYIDNFIIEHKPNIVKRFLTKQEFLEFIK